MSAIVNDLDLNSPPDDSDRSQGESGNAASDTRSSKWQELIDSLLGAWPTQRWAEVGVLVGCSGGADSVALARLLHTISRESVDGISRRGFIVLAHFDHGLRGDESRGDRDFVVDLAARLGVDCRLGTSDSPDDLEAGSTRADEAYLRSQRYAFLKQAAGQTGCRYIALAHSLDDNVETVLHHLMRGTGPAGLAGIAPAREAGTRPPENDFVITRPLLSVRRQLIRDGLSEIGQAWREDSSNTDTDYQRNWIRGELLPLMQTRFPEVIPAIGRAIDSQRQWRSVIDQQADQWIASHASIDPIVLQRRADHDPSVTIAALQMLWKQSGWSRTAMGQRHWQQLVESLVSTSNHRYSLPGEIDVLAEGDLVTVKVLPRDQRRSEA
ncbi:tRNA lysidine(34) synthetase TilS [Stieleria marina]|uniref:tRNA(Ile)-lysidine synthase n=1 Tax=Stieleria marina TaxID=1930275 RepID=A0A517NVY9_9BACT|nr:tRNA(Ile)-lysidine synthase [Planctomycetes bacterium K23_9]